MYKYSDIKEVQVEISEKCNAACPACPRNFYGYSTTPGLYDKNMTLDEFKSLFTPAFIKKLRQVSFCGNLGDAQMNSNLPDMVDYLFSLRRPSLCVEINTNGGMHSTEYWANFAKHKPTKMFGSGLKIIFAIDGTTQEVHSYYRRNTSLKKVLANAKAFIDAGGHAILQFIVFEHNKHQIKDAEKLAKEYNFASIDIINSKPPNNSPVYNSKGERIGILQNAFDHVDRFLCDQAANLSNNSQEKKIEDFSKFDINNYIKFAELAHEKYINEEESWQEDVENDLVIGSLLEQRGFTDYSKVDIYKLYRENFQPRNRQIECQAVKESKIFITVDGFVYPCCMIGMAHTRIANEYTYDLRALIKKFGYKNDVNNALKYGGIKGVFRTGFFNTIAKTWTPNTKENIFLQSLAKDFGNNGNLNMCVQSCSKCDYNDEV